MRFLGEGLFLRERWRACQSNDPGVACASFRTCPHEGAVTSTSLREAYWIVAGLAVRWFAPASFRWWVFRFRTQNIQIMSRILQYLTLNLDKLFGIEAHRAIFLQTLVLWCFLIISIITLAVSLRYNFCFLYAGRRQHGTY